MSLVLGTGGGAFAAPVNLNSGQTVRALAVSDFNRDGVPDIAVASGYVGNPTSNRNYISILLNGCAPAPRHRAVSH